jgi:hypothetical protein
MDMAYVENRRPVTHRMVGCEEELLDLMREELAAAEQRELVIMAGHFMLFVDEQENRLVPGIIEEQSSPLLQERISRRVGIFPTYTWNLGVRLGAEFAGKFADTRFLLLINDWQYVPAQGGVASDLRRDFYERFVALPSSYREALTRSERFGERNILPSRKHPIAFPETWLKYRFQKSAERLVKAGRLEKRVLEGHAANGTEVSFLDESGNYKPLITCGVTGCAGEITEMVSEVHRENHRLLIIFAPGECFQPVRTGVEIALDLYGLPGMTVIVADPGGSGEMRREDIYEKLVNFSVFRS